MGTQAQNINRWENNKGLPQPHHRKKYSEVFGLSIEELFSPENDATEQTPHPPANETLQDAQATPTVPPSNAEPMIPSALQQPAQSPRRFNRRNLLIGGLGIVGLIAVGGGAIYVYLHNPFAPPTSHPPISRKRLFTYPGQTVEIRALAWSPNGKRIASASNDYTAQIWDALTGESPLVYQHNNFVEGVAWSPDNTRIVTGCADGTAQIWNATEQQHILTYRGHITSYQGSAPQQGHPWVNRVSWSPDGTRIVSCDQTSDPQRIATAQVWNATTGETLVTYRNHRNGVYAVSWSPDGKRIASSGYDGTLQVWDATTGTPLATYRGNSFLFGLSWSPDNNYIAVGSKNYTVLVVDSTNGNVLMTFQGHYNWVKDVAWSPNGKFIASGSDDGLVLLWNAENGNNLATITGHSGHINAVGWSPDSTMIAFAGNYAQVWQAI